MKLFSFFFLHIHLCATFIAYHALLFIFKKKETVSPCLFATLISLAHVMHVSKGLIVALHVCAYNFDTLHDIKLGALI